MGVKRKYPKLPKGFLKNIKFGKPVRFLGEPLTEIQMEELREYFKKLATPD